MENDQIYDEFYQISANLIEEYGNRDDIISSLLNVILVLTGARTACVIDSIRHNDPLLKVLLEILLEYYDLSITRLTRVEYLLYLTINKDFVEREYKRNPANVLGYCYNKNDFANVYIDRIAVEFIAKSKISGYEINLFTTVIPSYAYVEKDIQQCIVDRVNMFDSVLNNLDYSVLILTRRAFSPIGEKGKSNYNKIFEM